MTINIYNPQHIPTHLELIPGTPSSLAQRWVNLDIETQLHGYVGSQQTISFSLSFAILLKY